LKRLILLGSLVVLFTPNITTAHGDDNNGRRHRRHIGATEFASVGFAAAAMIGVAGYFSLRRRKAN
jgi:hypothetical protein